MTIAANEGLEPHLRKGIGGIYDRTPKGWRLPLFLFYTVPKIGLIYLVGKYLVAKQAVFFTTIGILEGILSNFLTQ